MRILDSNKIDYKIYSYETKKGEHIDGVEVAQKIGKKVSQVYKTLVAQGISKNIYVYVIPVDKKKKIKRNDYERKRKIWFETWFYPCISGMCYRSR